MPPRQEEIVGVSNYQPGAPATGTSTRRGRSGLVLKLLFEPTFHIRPLIDLGGRLLHDLREAHPSLDELTAFDRGHLQSEEREAVERHVAACASCCNRLEALGDDELIVLLRSSAVLSSSVALGDTQDLSPNAHDTPPQEDSLAAAVPPELADHPRYRVLAPLGTGGMGIVYKAEHRLMQRIVALKIIHKRLTERTDAVERFRQEVKAAARLGHPNIVAAYDAEQAGDLHFLVMEYIEGTNLDQLVRSQGSLPVALACEIARQAALGLQHAHERGMVHRDLKPHNLLLTSTGQVKILDFGLARFGSESNGASLTEPGTVLGTPDYIAPEQARDARQADIRADIYSLGCTLYFLLAGRPPFPEGSALQKLMAHQERTPPSLATIRPDVPDGLAHIVERLLAKNPAQRFQTPAEVAEQLTCYAAGDPSSPFAVLPSFQKSNVDTQAMLLATEPRPKYQVQRRWLTTSIATALLLALLLCGLIGWWMHGWGWRKQSETGPVSAENELLPEGEIGRIDGPVGLCFRAVVAPDCRHALVAGLDFNVYLWNLENGRDGKSGEVVQLKGHTGRPMSFAFAHDGRRALSGGMDATVRLWDLEQRRLLRTFDKHTSWVRAVDFVGETGLAISGDNHGRVLLWDTRDGQLVHEFRGHEAVVYSIMASRSGRLAVSTSDDRTVRVWDLSLIHEAHCLRGHEDKTVCAVLSADDRLVVSGSADHTVRVWDIATEQIRWVLRGHDASISAVAISADSRRALSGDVSGTIRLWDLENGEKLRVYKLPVKQIIRAIAFCPDDQRIISAGDDGIFRFWRLP